MKHPNKASASKARVVKTHLSLYIYVTLSEPVRQAYYVAHLGFFRPGAAIEIADDIDIVGLAYMSKFANQSGRVELVARTMRGGDVVPDTTVVLRSAEYPPRERLDDAA